MFTAIMDATQDSRIAKRADFSTEAEAQAHVDKHNARFPNAFVVTTPIEPEEHWLLDMVVKTITIVPPPPPDFSTTDQATVDRLLLESGVLRALATVQFQIINGVRALEGEESITVEQYKTRLWKLIRG